MLPDVQFDIVQLGPDGAEQVHQRTTDAEGLAFIEFHEPTRIRVRELLRQSGGMWGITTPHQRAGGHWYILPQVGHLAPRSGPVIELGPVNTSTSLTAIQGDYQESGDCDDVDLWVGNARSFLPKTGAGGSVDDEKGGRAQQVDPGIRFD
jgi:hypothetical protein